MVTVYKELNEDDKSAFIARSILRDPFYGTIIRDILTRDVTINNYLQGLSPSTIHRRSPGIMRILKYALNAAKKENIELHHIVKILPPK